MCEELKKNHPKVKILVNLFKILSNPQADVFMMMRFGKFFIFNLSKIAVKTATKLPPNKQRKICVKYG